MLSANFQPKTTSVASRGSLATARLSCYHTVTASDVNDFQNRFTGTVTLASKFSIKPRTRTHQTSNYSLLCEMLTPAFKYEIKNFEIRLGVFNAVAV